MKTEDKTQQQLDQNPIIIPDYPRTSATVQANFMLSGQEVREPTISAGPQYGGFSRW